MRVLQVVPAYFPVLGGIEVLVDSLSVELLNVHSIESRVVAPTKYKERPDLYTHNGIEVHSFEIPKVDHIQEQSLSLLKLFTFMRRQLNEFQPDLIHIHGYSEYSLSAYVLARSTGTPYLIHVHGGVDPKLPQHYLRIVRQAEWACAVSSYVAGTMSTITGRQLNTQVIPNGIPDPPSNKVPYPPEDGKHRIVMVGRLEREKGFDFGLKALARLPEDVRGRLRIEIIGRGHEYHPLRNLTYELGLNSQTHFYGQLDHERALARMARADVVLIPSIEIEGFSLTAIESALLQRPVVAFTVGGLSETVEHNTSGLLGDIGNIDQMTGNVLRYLDNPQLRFEHGTSARRRALVKYSQNRFTRDILALYRSILDSAKATNG